MRRHRRHLNPEQIVPTGLSGFPDPADARGGWQRLEAYCSL
jgi:hypothetical protein